MSSSASRAAGPGLALRTSLWCAGARLVLAITIALVLTDPLARLLATTPGGEGGLFAGGGLTLLDVAMGSRPGSVAPSPMTLVVFASILALFEIGASAALFCATHAPRFRVLAGVGRVFPRFVLLAGLKLAVSAILFGTLIATLPTPRLDWLSSRFGWAALALTVFAYGLVALVLRVVFDAARGVSVARDVGLGALVRSTWSVIARRAFALSWRLVVVEAARLVLLLGGGALGYLALTRRFGGAPAVDFVLAFVLQQALVMFTVVLDAVWVRAVTRAVASARS